MPPDPVLPNVTPAFLPRRASLWFPSAHEADEDGLLAVGGDLTPTRLLLAYDSGIFPWYDEGLPPLWWSPHPRAVLAADRLHVSRRLRRRLARGEFELTWDEAFADVIDACGDIREDGTWIIPEMRTAYIELHALGHAHSMEAWQDGELVGGLYGVHRGGLFAAESMFHTRSDASKAALVACVRSVTRAGVELIDVQLMTDHLESMGAEAWPRTRYLEELARVRGKDVSLAGLEPDWRE